LPAFPLQVPGQPPASLVWNGATWSAAPLALVHGKIPDLSVPFSNLSCGSARNCVAIGSYQRTPHSPPLPVAEHWNGSTWQVTQIPIP
jgi:hypothetical protein